MFEASKTALDMEKYFMQEDIVKSVNSMVFHPLIQLGLTSVDIAQPNVTAETKATYQS